MKYSKILTALMVAGSIVASPAVLAKGNGGGHGGHGGNGGSHGNSGASHGGMGGSVSSSARADGKSFGLTTASAKSGKDLTAVTTQSATAKTTTKTDDVKEVDDADEKEVKTTNTTTATTATTQQPVTITETKTVKAVDAKATTDVKTKGASTYAQDDNKALPPGLEMNQARGKVLPAGYATRTQKANLKSTLRNLSKDDITVVTQDGKQVAVLNKDVYDKATVISHPREGIVTVKVDNRTVELVEATRAILKVSK